MPDFCESSGVEPPFAKILKTALASLLALVLAGCGPQYTLVSHRDPAKADAFGYRRWVSANVKPDVVIIGIHGFCGASQDYTNLGNHLLEHQPKTALYAYEVRGQGSDPVTARRGDIDNPEFWYRDLFAFTQLVQERHPGAKIIWFGESMGALIAAHAWRVAPANDPPCDGLILSSPIVRYRDDIPAWTPSLVKFAASTLPLARISTETLTGGQDIQMTQTSHHNEQTQTNSYNVDKHTLRLIDALSQHIGTMNDCAASFRTPVLVLHGGQDFLNTDSDVRGFVARIPSRKTYHNYPQAYHLLMYDQKREEIFRDVEKWVNKLR